jgi:hypothetical protein
MSEFDALTAELRALGRTLTVAPPPEDLAAQVLARLPAEPTRRRSPGRWLLARRRRLVAVVVAVVIIGLALTPPVRAAVVEWLRIGGVLIKTAPAPTGPAPTADPVPTAGAVVTLAEAQALVSFPIGVPEALGPPEQIVVSADRRVVSMDWTVDAVPVHLDQFDGELSWIFIKRAPTPLAFVAVNGRDAIWFPTPHEVAYIDSDGVERTEQARIAGPCLVWERPTPAGPVTQRLEGDLPQDRAITIAESVA